MEGITDELKDSYDVVIVGSGPAGAGAAKALTGSGLKTAIIEKAPLPRDKMCSGILLPRALKFISDDYGVLPEKVFCQPKEVFAHRMYMSRESNYIEVPWDSFFDKDMPKVGFNTYRSEVDLWLCKRSDASLVDKCLFIDYTTDSDDIIVEVKHSGNYRKIKTKYLVGADGTRSRVRRSVSPEFEKALSWIPAYEEWYKGDSDLEPGFQYIFFETDGYAFLFHKDGEIQVCYIAYQGKSCKKYLSKFRDFLIEKHNLRIDKTTMTRGIMRSNMLALKKYLFGKDNVLIAGEASGIMEAIDPALASGKAAGQSVLKSLETGKSALECYMNNELLLFEKENAEKTVERIRSDLGFFWYDKV